ncbi:hypothetical protein [Salinicoccus sp. HZC-1]|uniref:phage tail protein n=1 Tax=Salinicoccus sp. HZC-1 TaxID=3385497 RepID=UPI00398BAF67
MAGEANYSIEADVKANISKFRGAIKAAKQTLRSFETTAKSVEDTKIDGDVSPLRRQLAAAKSAMQAFTSKEYDAEIDGEISGFRRSLLIAKALAQSFSAKEIVKHVKFNFGQSRQNLRNFVNEVGSMNDNFQLELMRLAKMISSVGIVIGNVIRGSMIASFSALVPIISGVVSAAMAFGNSIGVMTGNILAFVGALGIAGAGAAAYGGLVTSVLSRYNSETFEATEASNRFTKALDTIKASWNGIVDSQMDTIFQTMGQGIYAANHALMQMVPFIDGVVASVTRMTNEFKAFIMESPTMLRFFDNMNTKGVAVFENIIRGVGRFGQGLVDMVNASMPLIEWVARGFNNLGTRFSEWANRMAEQNGFHEFISFVQENMPVIGKIFGDFFLGVINLFAAFGENSTTVLNGLQQMMERFRTWSETIKQSDGFQQFIDYVQQNGPTLISLIGNIVRMIVNFGIAIAPLASKVLTAMTAFSGWAAEILKTHPIVGMIIGVIGTLSGIFMMLVPAILVVTKVIAPFIGLLFRLFTQSMLVKGVMALLRGAMVLLSGPVGIVIGVLTALSAVFIMLYQNVEWFRNMVNTAWTFITNFISQQVNAIISWFNFFRSQGQGIFTSAMSAIATVVLTGFVRALAHITNFVSSGLVKIGIFLANLVSDIVGGMARFAAALGTGLVRSLVAIGSFIAQALARMISFGARLVSTIVSATARFVASLASGFARAISATISFVARGIAAIVRFATQIVVRIATGMAQFVMNIISGGARALSALSSFVSSAISTIVRFAAQLVSNIISGMANFVSAIVSGGSNAVSAVVSFGGEMVSSALSFVGDFVTAGRDLVMGLVDGIKGAAQNAVDAATGMVSGALNAAKSLLGINSPSKVFKEIGQYTSQGLAIGIDKDANKAVDSVGNVARRMTQAFAPSLVAPRPTGLSNTFRAIKKQASMHIGEAFNSTVKLNKQPAVIYLNMGNRTFKAHVNDITNRQVDESNLEEVYGGA